MRRISLSGRGGLAGKAAVKSIAEAEAAGWHHWIDSRRGIAFNLFLILPLLIVYEVGLLVASPDLRNAAEVILKDMQIHMGGDFARYAHWILAFVIIGGFIVTCRDDRSFFFVLGVVLLQSIAFAIVLGPLLSCVTGGALLQYSLTTTTSSTLPSSLMLSIGAGVYEEIVFRFLILGGLFMLLRITFSAPLWLSAGAALLVSSALFSGYHHWGPHGEPFSTPVFFFRAAAGCALGLLCIFRGFGVAVYVHAFYDIFRDVETALRGG
jgi:membrane protease YdiL (CAAX protease family)